MFFCPPEEKICNAKKETAYAVSFPLVGKPTASVWDGVPDAPFLSPACVAVNTLSRW